MKGKRTELIMILDKSGSMAGLESDTIGGYNAMLSEQRKMKGEVLVTTVLFNDAVHVLHDRQDIRTVRPMSHRQYRVSGTTALLDALGSTISHMENVMKADGEMSQVIFVITTDGMENSSVEFHPGLIKEMILRMKKNHGWEFIFLGANIDAYSVARDYGISRDRAVNYHADSQGTSINFRTVSHAVENLRTSEMIPEDWKKDIEEDFRSRGKKRD